MLQATVDDLRIKYESLLREAEDIRGGKDAEVKKVKTSVRYVQLKRLLFIKLHFSLD